MRIGACLLLQACLLLFQPGLLPIWGDEQFTLDVAAMSPPRMIAAVAADNHPPAYYLLVWAWLRLVPVDPLVAARLLSALTMLVASFVFWRSFLARLPDRAAARWLFLLWVLSPFVLMYGRMARSYGLQLLLFLLAIRAAEKALETGRVTRTAGLVSALLYVHYVPGFCALASILGMLGFERRWKRTAAFLSLVLLAYAPWIVTAFATASRELTKNVYLVFEGHLAEHPLRIAYTWIAWHFGETLPPPLIAAGFPLSLFIAYLAARSAAAHRCRAGAFALALAAGYFAVSRVVIFSLVPARLLFLLPFWAMLAGTSRRLFPRASLVTALSLLLLEGVAIANYFSQTNYRNKGYLIPFGEIASRFQSAPAGSVLVDIHSVDTRPLWPRIPARLRAGPVQGPLAATAAHAGDPVIFHVRGPRDLSPGRWNDEVDRELSSSRSCSTEGFTPYDRYDRWMMGLLGWPERPTHMLLLVTCRL